MIGKIVTIGFLLIGTASAFYKAGKYANGGKDVTQGKGAAVVYGISAILNALLALALYIDF